MVLNWFLKPEEALMLQTASPLILKLSLFLMTAVATHLVMSFGQTLIHYKVAHHPMGGKFFRNHINFHHTHYSDAHLVSRTYLGDEGNIDLTDIWTSGIEIIASLRSDPDAALLALMFVVQAVGSSRMSAAAWCCSACATAR
jgi:hypothetical protein